MAKSKIVKQKNSQYLLDNNVLTYEGEHYQIANITRCHVEKLPRAWGQFWLPLALIVVTFVYRSMVENSDVALLYYELSGDRPSRGGAGWFSILIIIAGFLLLAWDIYRRTINKTYGLYLELNSAFNFIIPSTHKQGLIEFAGKINDAFKERIKGSVSIHIQQVENMQMATGDNPTFGDIVKKFTAVSKSEVKFGEDELDEQPDIREPIAY
ncbi:MAG: hypothetical protein LBN05_07950 [Oscillospiraceae bacterium]|jgi:hypothetical protein|nr:hypothetical protein [Oscillospiraceae bacterium]